MPRGVDHNLGGTMPDTGCADTGCLRVKGKKRFLPLDWEPGRAQ